MILPFRVLPGPGGARFGFSLALTALATGCGPGIDITETLQVTDVVTGYFDMGVVGGKNKLVPSIAFQVRNSADTPVAGVQLNAVFRVIGDTEELGSALVRGIDNSGLAPGATTAPFVLRSSLGYTGEQPRAQMLQHAQFQDVQVELFAKHGGRQWVKLGLYKIDRQLLTR
jgi:hypothetical protein